MLPIGLPRLARPARTNSGGAAWVIEGEENPYARFTLRDIAYDQPVAY